MSKSYHTFIFIALICITQTMHGFTMKINPWSEKKERETVVLNKAIDKPCEISIHNIKGSITVTASTKNKIHVEATKIGSVKSLESTKITLDQTGDKIAIKTVQTIKEPDTKECEVNYTITIPKTATVSTIHTVKGDIFVENSNGTIATTKEGVISIKNSTGLVDVLTDNGSINVSFSSIAPGQQVTAITGKGDITVSLPQQTVASLDAKTKSGGTVSSTLPIRTKPTDFKMYNKKTLARLTREVNGIIGSHSTDSSELSSFSLITDKGNIVLKKAAV